MIRNGNYDTQLGAESFLSNAGIWVTGNQSGEKRASLQVTSVTNYSSTPNGLLDSTALGPYVVTRAALDKPIVNWLDVAPLNQGGDAQMFGDAMVWSSLIPNPRNDLTKPLWSKPVEDLRIDLIVYTFEDPALSNTFFVRYFLTNDGPNILSDAFVGFRTDVDLSSGFGNCVSILRNSTGFIESGQISYTYDSSHRGDVELAPGCRSVVAGFTFLNSPTSQAGDPATSHTITRKRNYVDPDFGEANLIDQTNADNMLRGLSVHGDQMVDSTTGLPTSFAFTGDPVAQTGWLDASLDIRSLMSSGPFTLAPGESTSLILAFVISEGANLSDAIQEMIRSLDEIRSDKLLWDF
jgi:hypothetical protein